MLSRPKPVMAITAGRRNSRAVVFVIISRYLMPPLEVAADCVGLWRNPAGVASVGIDDYLLSVLRRCSRMRASRSWALCRCRLISSANSLVLCLA